MKNVLCCLLLVAALPTGDVRPAAAEDSAWRWMSFPDSARFDVRGLHWFPENSPNLWRMPAKQMSALPKGVQGRSRCPSGGRIAFRSDTTRVAVRAVTPSDTPPRKLDVYVDGKPIKQAPSQKAGDRATMLSFENLPPGNKEIVIYLPHLQEVTVTGIGVYPEAAVSAAAPRFAKPLPVVFYGSSVCQGSAASGPSQTYPAILCRKLNLDFVNLGFGGAGKAEPKVVDLVRSVPACCYVFDLGKSYGSQDATAFKAMLGAVRKQHPTTPIVVITPITSAREVKDPAYSKRSIHTREVMRAPASEMIRNGDGRLSLVEGEDLIGFKEHAALSKDGVHPSDSGYALIASKLEAVLRKALGL